MCVFGGLLLGAAAAAAPEAFLQHTETANVHDGQAALMLMPYETAFLEFRLA